MQTRRVIARADMAHLKDSSYKYFASRQQSRFATDLDSNSHADPSGAARRSVHLIAPKE